MPWTNLLGASALALAATALGTPASVLAANPNPPNVVDLANVDQTQYRDGWQAEELLDEDVYGPNGDDVGEVEDILVGPDNRIRAIIVETNAFLDIGDTHARIDWGDVSVGADLERVTVPVTEDTLDDYAVNYDDMNPPRAWRVREVIGDVVNLEDRNSYGVVDDVLFDQQGKLLSVVVRPNARYGTGAYAYPFYGYNYGWEPGQGYYDMPYTTADVGDYRPMWD